MDAENIIGTRIGILGAGKSGLAAARLLLKKGADVFLSDYKTSAELEKECRELSQSIVTGQAQKFTLFDYELGGHLDKILLSQDLLVISPGIGFDNPIVIKALEKSIPVVGELEVASWFCRNPVIAITGTNGKTTVTMMLDKIFNVSGKPACIAGNIGTAFGEIVEDLKSEATVILEVSSYQLETIAHFHPKTAVILNITPDHLHRHKNMDEYTKCKLRIGENQTKDDVLILNRNDTLLTNADRLSSIPGNALRQWFNNRGTIRSGAGIKKDTIFLFVNGKELKIMGCSDISVPGAHNIDNALAAATAAHFSGISPDYIRKGLRSFKGLEHRLENAGIANGITFINDSKATNIDAMIAALRSFAKPVILIAGGEDKGTDLSVAEQYLKDKVKLLILLGEAAERMANAWGDIVYKNEIAGSLKAAVHTAFKKARTGDTVLLSPGCASFDMFKSFEERGNVFKEIVRGLG
ncbi:hypothetical protein AMJ80_11615 [bacterium SM23_31]|nr:MAG: hypothetical protein AMJ80_11615 [bacterium SM23_31]